jgi:hypothetical protein
MMPGICDHLQLNAFLERFSLKWTLLVGNMATVDKGVMRRQPLCGTTARS